MDHPDTPPTDRRCHAGPDCAEYDRVRKQAPLLADATTPLCPDCLRVAERDTRSLTYDYIDLEQHLPPTLGRALDTQTTFGGTREPPPPLRTSVEELQRNIWWVTTCWAEILGEQQQLAEPPWLGRTASSDPKRRVRDGYAVKWAVDRLTPRLRQLSRLGPTEVAGYPDVAAGEDATVFRGLTFTTLTGVEAVTHLQQLHQRARATLGRTRRKTRVPGRCGCGKDGNYLYRDEPRYEGDPCHVYCGACPSRWTPDEYGQFVGLMTAHPELADVEGIDYGATA